MKKRGLALALALVISSGLVLAGPSAPASAATCNPHCYGIATMVRAGHGGTTDMRVTCLSVANWQSQFVDQELWVLTNSGFSNWVEEGMTHGTPRSTRSWFWADSRPGGGGYHEHYPAHSADLNTTYILTISYAGGNNWNVYEHGGSPIGVSGNNNGSSTGMEVGEEITDTTAQGAAVHSSLWYKDTADNFHQSWPGSSITGHNPPTAQWLSQNNSMRAYSNCPAPSVAGGQPGMSASLDVILSSGRDVARQYGAGNLPTSLSYVRGSRSAAARALPGSGLTAAGLPVVVVTMTGNFAATGPVGASAGRGTVLTTIYDEATGRLLGASMDGSAPDLRGLGEGTVVYKQTNQVSASVLSTVLGSAKQLAVQNGERTPANVRYVQSTRAAANEVMTGSRVVDTDPSVIVVTMSGRFVGYTAKVPAGQALPTGESLTAVYDANTGELTDWSITPAAPALAALGTVRHAV